MVWRVKAKQISKGALPEHGSLASSRRVLAGRMVWASCSAAQRRQQHAQHFKSRCHAPGLACRRKAW